MARLAVALAISVAVGGGGMGGGLGGCAASDASRGTGPYQSQSDGGRDNAKAQRLTQEAAALLDTNPQRAETLLRDALTADLYHGPAHNNLGVL